MNEFVVVVVIYSYIHLSTQIQLIADEYKYCTHTSNKDVQRSSEVVSYDVLMKLN